MELKPYKTLMSSSSDELIINKSRFICYGSPAQSEEEALSFLKEIRSRHADATHNCYAYAIGPNMGIMRYSDDGEPGGTAGLPMMEVIKARQVTNCILVITRYFGGILLGSGGLVRAYSQGASLAVNACGVGVIHPTARYLISVSYSMLGRAEFFLKSQPVRVEDKQFTDAVTLQITVKNEDEDQVIPALISALDGKCDAEKIEEVYMVWEI